MAQKIKGQRMNGVEQDFFDVGAIHEVKDSLGNEYLLSLDSNDNVIATVKETPSASNQKIKGQLLRNGTMQDFYDVDALRLMTDEFGRKYTAGVDEHNNVIAVPVSVNESNNAKVKGQRLDNGEYRDFFDAYAQHVLTNSSGDKYTIALDELGDVIAVKKEDVLPPSLVTSGLVKRYRIVDGKLMDLVSNTDATPGTTYDTETFLANKVSVANLDAGSIEVIAGGYTSSRSIILFSGSSFSGSRVGISKKSGSAFPFGFYSASGSFVSFSGNATDTLFGDSNGLNLFSEASAPKVGNILFTDAKQANLLPFTHGFYFDLNGTETNSKKRSLNGLVKHNENEAQNIRPSAAENGLSISFEAFPAYEIRVYNRFLTDEEIATNAIVDGTHYSTIDFTNEHFYDGFYPFGARPALKSQNALFPNCAVPKSEIAVGTHEDISGNSYTVSALTPYTEPERTESVFEGIKFISVPEKLYTFRKYSVCAMPYPLNEEMYQTDAWKFHVMYSSSDESVCSCVDGVLVPKAVGEVTITARLAGSQLTDSFTVSVEVFDDSVPENKTLYLHRNYTINGNALNSSDSTTCALAMFGAIKTAAENGYRKIVFPKMDYSIYPVFTYGERRACCKVPSNFVIDFNGSDIFIEKNPMSLGEEAAYRLFVFTDGCEYSSIKNGTFYGERLNGLDGHAESDFSGDCGIVTYNNCYMCGTDHVSFDSTVGHHYVFSSKGQYDYWSGNRDENWTENSGLANRGRIRANELELGDFDSNGEAVNSNDHIRTKVLMDIGYDNNDLKNFCIGTMGVGHWAVSSRWVKVWWYDNAKTLINSGGTMYFQWARYHIPSNARYFKLSAYGTSVPTANVGEDACVLRLYPYKAAYQCYANNMVSTNANGWSISMIGGQHNYVGNSVMTVAKKYAYYAVDLEDNYPIIQCCVFDNNVAAGFNIHGGHGHALTSCTAYGTTTAINMHDNCWCNRVLNCLAGSIRKSAKQDCVYRGNLYTTRVTTGSLEGALIETDISSTGTNNLNNF